MIASLMLGEIFGAEFTAVCTVLLPQRRMRGVVNRAGLLYRAPGLRLAPTIQSEKEAFQCVELE